MAKMDAEERKKRENEIIGESLFIDGQVLEVVGIDFDEESDPKYKQPLCLFLKTADGTTKRFPIKSWARPKITNNNEVVKVKGTYTEEIMKKFGSKAADFIQKGKDDAGKKVKSVFTYFHTVGQYGVYPTFTVGFDKVEK